jgi:hypothetical protein
MADLRNYTSATAPTKLHTDSESISSCLNAAFILGSQGVAPS